MSHRAPSWCTMHQDVARRLLAQLPGIGISPLCRRLCVQKSRHRRSCSVESPNLASSSCRDVWSIYCKGISLVIRQAGPQPPRTQSLVGSGAQKIMTLAERLARKACFCHDIPLDVSRVSKVLPALKDRVFAIAERCMRSYLKIKKRTAY